MGEISIESRCVKKCSVRSTEGSTQRMLFLSAIHLITVARLTT